VKNPAEGGVRYLTNSMGVGGGGGGGGGGEDSNRTAGWMDAVQ